MSKKSTKKKFSRKTLRAIRKTAGTLCLIMAILVAMIPTDTTTAAGPTGGIVPLAQVPVINYGVSDYDEMDMDWLDVSTLSGVDVKKGYTIRELSSGKFYLDYAYEYYLFPGNENYRAGGVISKYNTGYSTKNSELSIDIEVVTQYPTYTSTEVTTFLNDNAGTLLTDDDLAMYFPSEWAEYKAAFDRDPLAAVKPSHMVSELTTDQKMSYFCEHTIYTSTNTASGNTYAGEYMSQCVLREAYDVSGDDAATSSVYIPYNTATGQWYAPACNVQLINYIGKGAFKDASNITSLTIPEEIYVIGDEAFKGVSGIKSINISAEYIGNRAFEDCTSLTSLTFEGVTEVICTEAFKRCNRLTSITLNSNVEIIGEGAFAYCGYLRAVDMSAITKDLVIKKFAFYDDYALNSVNFSIDTAEIEDGAFAVETGVTGNWIDVKFPDQASVLGDYVMSGRANLKTCIMPSSFGSTQTNNVLGSGFFKGCVNLNMVEFPDNNNGSCGYVKFEPNAFVDVVSDSFYIAGPGLDITTAIASPRKCARAAGITYKFIGTDGKTYYETGNGEYLYLVNSGGVLEKCTLIVPEDQFSGEITIPNKVGEIVITAVGSGCFESDDADVDLKMLLKRLIITDDSIKTIAADAFKDFKFLEYVRIGNTVTDIGANAFAGCSALKEVDFATPLAGYASLKIGDNAFLTGGTSLIFYGDINPNYAPFKWAMQEDNYMDEIKHIRVCYKTGNPTNLTVMRDEATGLVTLIDYPHYELIDEDVKTAYEKIYVEGDDSGTYELTAEETAIVKAALSIDIPEGVQSIDVKGFINEGDNYNNCQTYLKNSTPYYDIYKNYGLFNGFYGLGGSDREYPEGSEYELVDRGNDRVLSIKMNDIQYLPDNAFFSCENLEVLQLGEDLKDLGVGPIVGCDSLSGIVGNSKYICENGIIYSTNDDKTLNIVQCLSGRGDVVGEKFISTESDANLSKVSTISEGAFQNATSITKVDLSGCDGLRIIPPYAFDGCTELRTVLLPNSLEEIESHAFTGTAAGISATITGKETQIDNDAFDQGMALIRTYKNTAAATFALTFGHDIEYIEDTYSVYFIDYDGTELCDVQYIEEGKNATPPEAPKRTGYKFVGWSANYIGITQDTIVVAMYELIVDTNTGNNTDQNKTYKLTVESGTGSGTYKAGVTVTIKANDPPAGKTFSKWVSTNGNLQITSATSATTTITMPALDTTVTATYVNLNSSGSNNNDSSNNTQAGDKDPSGGSGNTGGGNGDTSIEIDKDDISNEDKAGATVDGSNDNYVIKITNTNEARVLVEAALMDKYGTLENLSYSSMDISLYDSTGKNKITDTKGIKINITIPIPDDLIQYAGNNRVAAVVDGKLEVLKTKFVTIDGVKCVQFTATHFSPYTVYVDKSNLMSGVIDDTPQTGDFLHPKWFVVIALGCMSAVLFLKKDKKSKVVLSNV